MNETLAADCVPLHPACVGPGLPGRRHALGQQRSHVRATTRAIASHRGRAAEDQQSCASRSGPRARGTAERCRADKRRDQVVGVELRSIDCSLEVEAEVDMPEERVEAPLLLLVATGGHPRQYGLPSRNARPRDSVARGRAPGRSEDGSPSSSQNICARVPSGHPSEGITGELCSQPPLGVAESMFPRRSTTSRCTVSPRVGSPAPRVGSASTSAGSLPKPGS